jgi:hypothetical protein
VAVRYWKKVLDLYKPLSVQNAASMSNVYEEAYWKGYTDSFIQINDALSNALDERELFGPKMGKKELRGFREARELCEDVLDSAYYGDDD